MSEDMDVMKKDDVAEDAEEDAEEDNDGDDGDEEEEEEEEEEEDLAFELFGAAQAHEDAGELDEAFAAYERIENLARSKLGARKDPGLSYEDLVANDEPPLHVLAATAANCAGGLFLDEGDFEEARAWFQRSTQWWSAAVMARLNLANIEREHGNPEAAIALYNEVVEHEEKWRRARASFLAKVASSSNVNDAKNGGEVTERAEKSADSNDQDEEEEEEEPGSSSWVASWLNRPLESCGQQAAYLIALMHHQWGNFDAAIPFLQKFPIKWRIGPAVWNCVGAPAKNEIETFDESCPVRLVQGALGAELMDALQEAFRPSSPFWDGTNYCDGAYFSFWYDVARKPSNLVEQAIQELLTQVDRGDIVGAEWWVHSRPSGRNLGHQLHFDTEENSLGGDNETILHPAVSSVLYLSGAETGAGPTVVFDQRVADTEPAQRAFVSNPVDGSFLTFPGNRLHGVLPGRPPKPGKRTRQSEIKLRDPATEPHRLTLLVGFWDRDVQKIGKRHRLGPCAPFPRVSRGVEWPSEINMITLPTEDARSKTASKATPLPLHKVPQGQAWEAVPSGPDAPLFATLPEGLDQHFFVQDHADFRKKLLSSGSRSDDIEA